MNFRSIRIATRLLLLAGSLLVLLALVGVFSVRALSGADEGLRGVYEDNTVPVVRMGEALAQLYQARTLVLGGMGADSSDASDAYYKDIKPAGDKLAAAWTEYLGTRMDVDAKASAEKAAAASKAYLAAGDKVVSLAKGGDFEAASTLMRGESAKLFETARDATLAVMANERDAAKAAFESSSTANARVRTAMMALLAVGLLLGGGLSYLIAQSINKPLVAALGVARQVAEGDLSAGAPQQGSDETAQLLNALEQMKGKLAQIVGDVRLGSDNIASGTAEIASGNNDLSQRTEQQAGNLQTTVASMAELTQSVSNSADMARQANQLAGAASAAAERGGEVVGKVVSTMSDIAQASNRISDIIGTIDGIAFQTNILALNAAVEAARAGEQGRGFAVVAGEVRSLAQRSAEAAKEIKGLIGASVGKVEDGSRLVGSAGQAMDDIVSQVRKVSDLIGEISAATAEQTSGIQQVGGSVSELDNVNQQNAALAEQSAAAAENLKTQASRLAEMVSVFKL